jgi:hypothetical protein
MPTEAIRVKIALATPKRCTNRCMLVVICSSFAYWPSDPDDKTRCQSAIVQKNQLGLARSLSNHSANHRYDLKPARSLRGIDTLTGG